MLNTRKIATCFMAIAMVTSVIFAGIGTVAAYDSYEDAEIAGFEDGVEDGQMDAVEGLEHNPDPEPDPDADEFIDEYENAYIDGYGEGYDMIPSIDVTVTDLDDDPVSDLDVIYTDVDSGDKFTETTDSEGEYTINLLTGTYNINAEHPDKDVFDISDSDEYEVTDTTSGRAMSCRSMMILRYNRFHMMSLLR